VIKIYRQLRYGLSCPREYSNKPKLQSEPMINNGASAVWIVFVIVSKLLTVNLNYILLRDI